MVIIEIRASNDNDNESNSFYPCPYKNLHEHFTMRMYLTYAVYNNNLSDPYSTTFLQ